MFSGLLPSLSRLELWSHRTIFHCPQCFRSAGFLFSDILPVSLWSATRGHLGFLWGASVSIPLRCHLSNCPARFQVVARMGSLSLACLETVYSILDGSRSFHPHFSSCNDSFFSRSIVLKFYICFHFHSTWWKELPGRVPGL